jgi:hypothetical protein
VKYSSFGYLPSHKKKFQTICCTTAPQQTRTEHSRSTAGSNHSSVCLLEGDQPGREGSRLLTICAIPARVDKHTTTAATTTTTAAGSAACASL